MQKEFVVSGNDNASVQEVTGYGAHAYAACSYKYTALISFSSIILLFSTETDFCPPGLIAALHLLLQFI